jgi:RNA-directed DNA polymerase
MQDCLDELATVHVRSDRASHGFVRKKSIITNARQHRNRRWVLNLNLEDFFPSINFGRLRGYLIKNRELEFDPRVATVIAQIACNQGTLPQGSLELTRSRGHFPIYGERVHHGQAIPSVLPAGVSA